MDLGAVEHNCRRLSELLTGGAALCAVVKADGYGHGAVQCARAAVAGGAGWLAVATADEAAQLRGARIEEPLLVMGALTAADMRTALLADADVVAWTPEMVAALPDRAGPSQPRVHVKLDSGMGRLGTSDPAEARALCRAVADDPRLELAGLMTHFATADESGDDHFPAQLERFDALVEELRAEHAGLVVHAANSAAVFREPAAHYDMARCGVAIYGLDPFGSDPADRGLRPAMSVESYVASVKRFEPGDGAGYGQTWRASEPTDVAVLPIGYGDGWRRSLSNNARVLIGGRGYPLVGTVSMDNVTVDLGRGSGVGVGDRALLIGEQGGERILAEDVARAIGTINYEVTCGLTQRVRRAHRRGG
ncbi:MAG TPA: alanine racemase [Thermoleophilaceae bacterium]|nr:alanine racemase [Thermoleophilaceae bacterium]